MRPTHLPVSQWLREFPEMKGYVKGKIKEIKSELADIPIKRRENNNTWARGGINEGLYIFRDLGFEDRENKLKQKLNWYEKMLKGLEYSAQYQKKEGDKEAVKEIPIDELLEFNGANKAHCLWHNERSPSMHYYKKDNKVHCFGCGKQADTIDVLMALEGKTFKEVVEAYGNG